MGVTSWGGWVSQAEDGWVSQSEGGWVSWAQGGVGMGVERGWVSHADCDQMISVSFGDGQMVEEMKRKASK